MSESVIYCYVGNHLKTYWLKTETIFYLGHQSTNINGNRLAVLHVISCSHLTEVAHLKGSQADAGVS